MTFVRSINDLRSDEIDWVMDRARQHRAGTAGVSLRPGTIVGLAFLTPSLRTRVGFAAAAIRLGAHPLEVSGTRSSAVSMPESVGDTIRTLAGYSDVIVARVDEPLALPHGVNVPVLNGGDGGAAAEHPSQSLVDLFALQQISRDLSTLTIALCGDLRMRAARSLLLMLTQRRPRRLVLVTEPILMEGFELSPDIAEIVEFRSLETLNDVDALYIVGIPHGALDENGRTRLRVTKNHLDCLSATSTVLSPLPLIDEIERDAFAHQRVQMFDQSDGGLFVRMALLELLIATEKCA